MTAQVRTQTAGPRAYGFILVLISAGAFGAMPIFGRYAYAAGVDPVSLLFFRFLLATFCMAALMMVQGQRIPHGKDLVSLVLMGMIGYAGQAFCYFTALTMIPAGMVAILLCLYPFIVTVLSVLFLKESISPGKLLALALALGGSTLVIGWQIGGSPVGIAWGLAAAGIYSVYIIMGAKVMRSSSPFSSSTVIMAGAAITYTILAISRGINMPHSAMGWLWVGCIALLCTALAISAFFYGIKTIGAVDASLVSTFEPATTVVLAFLFLGERIGVLQILGMLLIMGAVVILALQPPIVSQPTD